MHRMMMALARLAAPAALLLAVPLNAAAVEIGGQEYASLQAAIDANPGRVLTLPAGDYRIEQALTIKHDGSGLAGEARIIQGNPDQDVILIQGAKDVRIKDLTLTRPEGKQDATRAAVQAQNCEALEISGVRVFENRSQMASILLVDCRQSRVANCLVQNYKRIGIDDRTKGDLYGYAFRAIDGTGIQVRDSQAIQITNNRVLEFNYIPTKENRDKYKLGELTVVPDKPGRLNDEEMFRTRYTCNWHQGAGLQVTGPYKTKFITITGNYFENAAQGMDIHADNVTIANNQVYRAMIGMKAMHGSKNVLITGNQFSHCDLWGLKLMPGTGSRACAAASGDKEATEDNSDGGHLVANNVFSHFGMGDQYWNWKDRTSDFPERNVITLVFAPLEENPPMKDVLVTGNVVYNSGRDKVLVDGKPEEVPPLYFYALYLATDQPRSPQNVHISNNLLDAGIKGVSTIDLEPATK